MPCRSSPFYDPASQVRHHHFHHSSVVTDVSPVKRGERLREGMDIRRRGSWGPSWRLAPTPLLSAFISPRVSFLGCLCSLNSFLSILPFEYHKSLCPHQFHCFVLLPVLLFSRPITPPCIVFFPLQILESYHHCCFLLLIPHLPDPPFSPRPQPVISCFLCPSSSESLRSS